MLCLINKMSKKKGTGASPDKIDDQLATAVDSVTAESAVYMGTTSLLVAESVVEVAWKNLVAYVDDKKLSAQEPGYVTEVGVVLATEPSLLMYFSHDLNRFHIDDEFESAEPTAAGLDYHCADLCKNVPGQSLKNKLNRDLTPEEDISVHSTRDNKKRASLAR